MPTGTDLVVIGAGPGGYTAAIRGAQKGLNVVLVERETVGGVCLNHGCIPAKALIHAAGFQRDIDHWNELGVETGPVDVDFQAIQDWKDEVIDKLDGQVLESLEHYGVELIEGTARFEDSSTLQVETDGDSRTLEFDQAIIATGSQPIEIPGLEYSQDRVISSREVLQVETVPDEIVVVGGGYIGMEAVTKFSKFGARVKIVEALDRVLSEFEEEIVDSIQETSEMYSDDIYTSTLAQGVEYAADGTPELIAEKNGDELRLSGDYIVVAAGREPNSAYADLELVNTAVDLTDNGFIAVDDQCRTTADNIFAVGDAAGPPYLAHVAYHEGKVAAAVAAGEDRTVDTEYMPTVMYTDPEVATVGLSEAEAAERRRRAGRSGADDCLGASTDDGQNRGLSQGYRRCRRAAPRRADRRPASLGYDRRSHPRFGDGRLAGRYRHDAPRPSNVPRKPRRGCRSREKRGDSHTLKAGTRVRYRISSATSIASSTLPSTTTPVVTSSSVQKTID